uniref:AsIV-cont00130-ORF1 n=1 Tax=Apophua simplicipes ichnovirus TaxID=1329648 RepID=S5DRD2_9VIRU|nr:AsIV-cont00130-ORF1 [Apophua simplicipes ichnovirus]
MEAEKIGYECSVRYIPEKKSKENEEAVNRLHSKFYSSPDNNGKEEEAKSITDLFQKKLDEEAKKERKTAERIWKRLTEAINYELSTTELVMSFWRILILIFTMAALAFLIWWKIPKDVLISKMVTP